MNNSWRKGELPASFTFHLIGQIYLNMLTVLWSPWNFTDAKRWTCGSEGISQGACPCLPPSTLSRHASLQTFFTTVFRKYGMKLARGGRNATSRKPLTSYSTNQHSSHVLRSWNGDPWRHGHCVRRCPGVVGEASVSDPLLHPLPLFGRSVHWRFKRSRRAHGKSMFLCCLD